MLAMLVLSGFGTVAFRAQAAEVLMPRWGKQVVEVSEELTFYDYKGTEDIQASNFSNSLATIVFKPAEPGKVIQITFEDFDVQSDFGSYSGYANVYNGEVDPDNTFVYPQTTGEVTSSSTLPDGDILEKLDGQYSDKTFMSTASDGALSVGFIYRYAKKSTGWIAKVSAVTVSDMEVTGAGGENGHVATAPTGKKGIALAGCYVDASGVLNPVSLTSVSFTVPVNEQVIDPMQLKLYAGSSSEYKDAAPLDATLAAEGDVYTFTLSAPLSDGRNVFTVGGDVGETAAFGSKVEVNVTKVCTSSNPSGVAGFAAAQPVAVTIPYMVLMSSGTSAYTIDDNSVLFFDDGGIDGKISENFTGTTVFKPAVSSKKVMVDFTKVTLFESSNKNEILKVYNGAEADEANLICRIMSGKPERVRSTAADGALTVSLVCDTGYPKDGFEATVSQFTPVAMTVENIAVAQYSEGTVCAGDKDQPILSFNIRTADTEPALTVGKIALSANGTAAQVVKASLYSTGRSTAFSAAEKVGEAVVSGEDYEINVTTPVSLTEGDNYFWVAYDIVGTARNGQKIDAALGAVTLSDGAHAVDSGSPEGDRTVENTAVSVVGSTEKTVYGTWTFKSEKNPLSYYDGYNPVEGDQITTFVPGTKGMIIELDIQSFDLYYSTSSYAPKAKFEVYSGKGTTGELLWSLTSADDKKTGPGRILRSQSADGALTVVFDAKTTSSSYTAKGWTSEVREYLSKPMTIQSVEAMQAAEGTVKAGQQNQEIIGFNVKTAGNLDAPVMSAATVDLKGSGAAVEKVYLYSTGAKSQPEKTTPIAMAEVAADATTVTLSLDTPSALLEGDNYYWVAYDLAAEAAVDTEIDAALVSVTAGGKDVMPADGLGNPDGSCTVKNLFLLQSGENGEVTIGDSSLMFYDVGGPDGTTPKGFNGTVTFVPKEEGKVIKMSFRKWSPNGNYDKMLVYYGGIVTSKEDLAIQAQDALPADIVSKADDGRLTVNFKSPSYSYASDGWEIEVCQYELQPLVVASVKTAAVAPTQVMRGMTDVAMLHVTVEVTGDKGNLELSSLGVGTDGTTEGAISGMSVFTTGLTTTFTPVDRIMHSSEAPYDLTGIYAIAASGIYNFWVTCDVSPEAEVFNTLKTALSKIVVSDVEYTPAESVVAESKVQKGLSGTFAVGEGCEYATIQSAIDAIQSGIDGPVTITVKKGEYNEKVTVPEIPGASAVNTITLRSESGNRDDVLIYHNKYSEPPYSDDQMSKEYGVITFDGVDYFTLKGVSVTTTDLSYPSVIHYRNQSRHVAVDNCHVYAARSESANTKEDLRLIYQYAKNEENCNNDYPTIRNSLLEGGYMGACIQGTSYVRLPKQRGALIENNVFRNQGSKAFYSSSKERDMTIRGNVFENTTSGKSGFQAIDIDTSENLLVEGNSFYVATAADATAINVRGIAGTAEQPGRIVNNEIAVVCAGTVTSAGIKLSSASTCVDIANNTVLMTAQEGKSGLGAALWLNNTTTGVTVRNNILMEKESGFVYRFYKDNCIDGVAFSNNMLYTNGGIFAKSNPTGFAGFADWTAVSGETGSFNEEVLFYSSTILFPTEEGNLRNGMPLEYVVADKDGAQRDAARPTMGAYEYSESTEVPAYAEGYPAFGGIGNVSAVASLNPTINATAFTVVKRSSETAPTSDEVIASETVTELRKGKVTELKLDGLTRQTEYRLYSVLMSLNGQGVSEVLASEPFSTAYAPTEVSTFENVTPTETGFEDGTAAFTGFTVETVADAAAGGQKAAKVGSGATIVLANTDKGLTLTGFFLKSDTDLQLDTYDGSGAKVTHTIPSTGGAWIFANLKDKGAISKLELATEGVAYIDNFSGEPLALSAVTPSGEFNATEGGEALIEVAANGGVYPYSYSWKDAMRKEVATTATCKLTELKHSGVYTVSVSDAWGNKCDRRVLLYVEGNAYAATFDDIYLAPESYYNGEGEDNGDWTNPGTDSKFFSGSYCFDNNRHTSTWWGGYGVSNQTSTDFASLSDQFKSAAGGGHNSAGYGVAYAPAAGSSYAIEASNNRSAGVAVSGFYVTNAAYTADAIVNGDGMSKPAGGFGKGDYFKLVVTAEKSDGTTATLDYYLADYRPENEADRYHLDTWQWVDLRSFGAVKKLTFGFEGTKKNEYGLTTPTYFCLDDFGGERVIADAPQQLAGISAAKTVELSDLFALDNDGSSTAYRIVDAYDETAVSMTIADGRLEILGLKDKQTVEAVVSVTQKGKIQFVRIPVVVDESEFSSVGVVDGAEAVLYPVPTHDRLNVRTAMEGYTIEVVSVNGAVVLRQDDNDGNVELSVGHLPKGVYMLTLRNDRTTIVKRFIIK